MTAAFFYSDLNVKKYWKVDFFSFWQDLGFDGCFFYATFSQKNIGQLIFSAFGQVLVFYSGKILVLMVVFFFSNSNFKVLES